MYVHFLALGLVHVHKVCRNALIVLKSVQQSSSWEKPAVRISVRPVLPTPNKHLKRQKCTDISTKFSSKNGSMLPYALRNERYHEYRHIKAFHPEKNHLHWLIYSKDRKCNFLQTFLMQTKPWFLNSPWFFMHIYQVSTSESREHAFKNYLPLMVGFHHSTESKMCSNVPQKCF